MQYVYIIMVIIAFIAEGFSFSYFPRSIWPHLFVFFEWGGLGNFELFLWESLNIIKTFTDITEKTVHHPAHTPDCLQHSNLRKALCPFKRSPCHRWRTKMPIERLYRAGWIKLLNCFVHQGKYLRNRETVTCCSNLCPFKSHIYPSFMSQKSCFRPYCTLKDFKKKKLKNW